MRGITKTVRCVNIFSVMKINKIFTNFLFQLTSNQNKIRKTSIYIII